MKYTEHEVLQYVAEEDVKFIRMTFCDVMGRLKNVSIMPDELDRAFDYGIAIDASAIAGFGDEVNSDLFLHPDASTIALLPWRPEHGSVVRMFCSITHPDGTPFALDGRELLLSFPKFYFRFSLTICVPSAGTISMSPAPSMASVLALMLSR